MAVCCVAVRKPKHAGAPRPGQRRQSRCRQYNLTRLARRQYVINWLILRPGATGAGKAGREVAVE